VKFLWAAVLVSAAGAALVFSVKKNKRFLLSFFAFLFSASFLVLPDWLGLEDHLSFLGQGLSVWAAAVFAALGIFFLFRESVTKEEKIFVEAAPLAEFFGSLKELLIHPYTLVEVFNLSLREISRLWNIPAGAVFIYNQNSDELLIAASFGLSREQENRWEKIRAKEELFSRAVKTGMGLVMGDLSHSRRSWAGLAPFTNFGSLVSIPLVGRERILGLLVLLSEKPYRFTRAEEVELAPVGLALGMFADGVRILREGRKRAEEAAFYRQDLEKTLGSFASLSTGDALHNILDAVAERLAYQIGLVLVKHGERWEVASASYEPLVGETLSPALTEVVTNGCQTSGAKKLSDLRFDGLTAPSGVEGEQLSSIFETHHELPKISKALLVPLFEDKKTIGALFFGFEADFRAGDYELAHIAGLAGVAALVLSRPSGAAPAENWVGALQTLSAVKSEDQLRSFLDFALATFFQFETGFLFRVDDDSLQLLKNWGSVALSPIELGLKEGVWGKIAAQRTPLLLSAEQAKELMQMLPRTAAEQILRATNGVGFPISQMAVPLSGRDSLWGVLSLERYRNSFNAAEFEKLGALAELVSMKLVALEGVGVAEGVEVGNELNNDLTAILGNLELVSTELPEGSPLRNKLENLGELAQKAGEKVGRLTRSLASLSGAEKDINRLIGEVAEEENNLEVDLSPLPEVRIDSFSLKTFLREVIQELNEKGEGGALTLKTDTDNQYVYIRLLSRKGEERRIEAVAGAEPELAKALHGQAFGQMFRSDFSRLEESLSPSDLSWITEAGGQVSLVEDQEKGRSLTLRFPISSTLSGSKKGRKKSLKILAIDDQAIIRDLLVNMFGSAGHEVTTAERGEEGIAKFKIQRFDLVVTDLSMPDLSGWEVAREVKKMRPEVPVILITGWGQNFDEEKLKETGVDRVVTKPFRIEQLMKTVEELVFKIISAPRKEA